MVLPKIRECVCLERLLPVSFNSSTLVPLDGWSSNISNVLLPLSTCRISNCYRHLHFCLCPSNVFQWTSLEVENNGIVCLIQNTVPKKRTPYQSPQVKRNGPTIQLQHLDGSNNQHRLCFFLNHEYKNMCCASSNQLAMAATFPRAFYSPGKLVMLMNYKGS